MKSLLDCVWNMMAHAQKPDYVFRRNGRVHFNRRECQFSRILAAEVCASAVAMLDTPCSQVVWMLLATHSIRQFPLHFPSRASPCAITFQLDSTSRNMQLIKHMQFFFQRTYIGLLCQKIWAFSSTVVGHSNTTYEYSWAPSQVSLMF